MMDWNRLLSHNRPNDRGTSGSGHRSAFDQDFDRIIFSHPFRKLQDKTQVHPLPEEDFVHTRLTHSLEVSSVGRSLGREAGRVIIERYPQLAATYTAVDIGAIVASAALAHDIGNPPFGHTGEEAISGFFKDHPGGQRFRASVTEKQWKDLITFEGNAQGFRIISRGHYGLRLTSAMRGAFMKYPCPALHEQVAGRKSQKKYGYFESEASQFNVLAAELGLLPLAEGSHIRHPLAFLVEAADDICYSIIDLEDGCRLGLVTLEEVIELVAPILGDSLDRERLRSIPSLNEQLGVLRAMTINELTRAGSEVFLDHEQEILNGVFDQALTDTCMHRAALSTIAGVSLQRIYRARHVTEIEAAGFEILPGLLELFCDAAEGIMTGGASKHHQLIWRLLPAETTTAIAACGNDTYAMLRLVIDHVSGLTDRHALGLFRKLKGISR